MFNGLVVRSLIYSVGGKSETTILMGKSKIPPIEEGRVRLRLIEKADLPMTLKWRNKDHIRRWFINSEIILANVHNAWYKQYLERDNDFVFIIETRDDALRPVGQISVYNIDWSTRRAEFGRLIIGEDDARGRQLAQLATKLLLKISFNQFSLKEVYLEVYRENAPAIAVYQKCGFQFCGQHDNLYIMKAVSGNAP